MPGEDIREAIMNQTVPRCPVCCPDQGLNGGPCASTESTGSPQQKSPNGEAAGGSGDGHLLRSRGPAVPASLTANGAPEGSPIYGVMKPDIVFFGEGLPYEFHTSLEKDVHLADLVLVMGSSLKVRPVSHIPGELFPIKFYLVLP